MIKSVMLILTVMIFTVPSAFALTQFPDFYQGTSLVDSRSISSHLKWTINANDGIESGRTNEVLSNLIIDNALSFQATDSKLSTIKDVQVEGIANVLNVGSKYCFESPNWNFVQTVSVNGKSYNLSKQFLGSQVYNSQTKEFSGMGLKFTPDLIERLLNQQGVFLKNGDQVIWKVTANNRMTIAEGYVHEDTELTNESGLIKWRNANFGVCTLKEESVLKNADGDIVATITSTGTQFVDVDTSRNGWDAYAVGLQTEIKMTYFDPVQQLIGNQQILNDFDGDGIPDHLDLCTFDAENYNGFEDDDGCPDTVPPPINPTINQPVVVAPNETVIINQLGQTEIVQNLDFDNDGILNALDQCPNEPENFNGFEDTDGCPDNIIVDTNKFLQREFDRITQSNQQNQLPSNVHVDVNKDVSTEAGSTDECNNITENCNEVISKAVEDFEKTIGIKLPFEPTILNFAIIFGIIGVVIYIIAKVFKKV